MLKIRNINPPLILLPARRSFTVEVISYISFRTLHILEDLRSSERSFRRFRISVVRRKLEIGIQLMAEWWGVSRNGIEVG